MDNHAANSGTIIRITAICRHEEEGVDFNTNAPPELWLDPRRALPPFISEMKLTQYTRMIFTSGRATGKSSCLVALANALLHVRERVIYILHQDPEISTDYTTAMLTRLKQKFGSESLIKFKQKNMSKNIDILKKHKNFHVLIDEVDVDKLAPKTFREWDKIIDRKKFLWIALSAERRYAFPKNKLQETYHIPGLNKILGEAIN